MEETTEKYDRLVIKYRDLSKEYEQLSNIQEVMKV